MIILSSIYSKANETEGLKINCQDGLHVGKTTAEVSQSNFAITQEVYKNGFFSSKNLGTGHIISFYVSDKIAVLDLYQGLKKVGTLVAVNSEWGNSRIELKGNIIGLGLKCKIQGN